jgi:hypothetical protein
MRISHGHVSCVMALSLIMCKEEIATELIKWFLNGRLVNMIFFPKFK